MLVEISQADVTVCHANRLSFVADSHLLRRGVRHGFSMVPADFSRSVLEDSARLLCQDLAIECLVTLNQVHGTHIVLASISHQLPSVAVRNGRKSAIHGGFPPRSTAAATHTVSAFVSLQTARYARCLHGHPWPHARISHLGGEISGRAAQDILGPEGSRSARLGDGDGLFWRISDFQTIEAGPRIAFGILCADCLPVLLCSQNHGAMVHAGWRGMAGGILEASLAKFAAAGEKAVTVLLGPAACGRDYEVGPEVFDALGDAAYFEPSPRGGGRRLVCLQRTAARRLSKESRLLGIELEMRKVPISTISDRRFHSHRRDGAAAGRGLAFMLC